MMKPIPKLITWRKKSTYGFGFWDKTNVQMWSYWCLDFIIWEVCYIVSFFFFPLCQQWGVAVCLLKEARLLWSSWDISVSRHTFLDIRLRQSQHFSPIPQTQALAYPLCLLEFRWCFLVNEDPWSIMKSGFSFSPWTNLCLTKSENCANWGQNWCALKREKKWICNPNYLVNKEKTLNF